MNEESYKLNNDYNKERHKEEDRDGAFLEVGYVKQVIQVTDEQDESQPQDVDEDDAQHNDVSQCLQFFFKVVCVAIKLG